ncbi:MAG: YlxR family protein [Dehalococcoidia bacterium]|nr:YlxR family protein [Dehalococcoidia bacterium]
MTGSSLRPRHVPQRTCIACRQEAGKRALIRIVRTPDQRIIIDETGRANGRGAYLHPVRTCWVKALKGGTIKNALKITPAPEDVERLRAFGETLPAEESEPV